MNSDPAARWFSIVPPLLAVCLAFVTRRIFPSLGAAVVAGGFLSQVPDSPLSPAAWGRGVAASVSFVTRSAFDEMNVQILAFVVLVIAMIAVLISSGGLQAIVDALAKYAKGHRSARFATALAGLIIFFDDYANTMIVGNAMRPLTDRHGVSREKLAFLVDATSAPVAGLAVLSTWIGYEVGLFDDISNSLGIGIDGYSLFLNALPFRFYCISMIAFILINSFTGWDFGPMAKAERRAREKGQPSDPDAQLWATDSMQLATPSPEAVPRLASAVFPLAVLFTVLLGSMWFSGGGRAIASEQGWLMILSPGAWRQVATQGMSITSLLMSSAAIALVAAIACAVLLSKVSPKTVVSAILGGAKSSLLPMSILLLAWALKASCDQLQTGKFLAATLSHFVSPLWFPALLFFTGFLTSFATGTSWGTMAILIPTAVPVAWQLDGASYGIVTAISLAAVLDGSIFGDHCSPISDTTIMSSAASSCDHLHHVRTQLPYSLLVGTGAILFGYLPAAMGWPFWATLGANVGALTFASWALARGEARRAVAQG